jgi:hypothetical protein
MLEDCPACEEGSDLDQALEKMSQKEHAKFVFSVGELIANTLLLKIL